MKQIFKVLLATVCLFLGMDATAQLVDRATFEQHLAKARSLSSQRKAAAASSPITLTQNPFEIEEFNISNNGTCDVKVYFNTAVMAAYRSECCPRITEFELALPNGFSVTSVKRGNDLQQSPITVTGAFDDDTKTLSFLGYGVCSAAELAQLPTGRIHYATITIAASNATVGDNLLNMSEARFAMADEPSEFTISGTTNYPFHCIMLATGISLNRTSATINNGETLQLTATVSPSNTSNSTVTWSSSNTNIATVNNNGLVTAKSRGTATITATTTDGSNLSASCNVTVNQLATGITLNKTTAAINNGETLQLTATVSPSNVSNSTVTWSSSNTSVATVNSDGLVTAKSRGNATITATTTDGTNLSASCSVTVTQLATGISLNRTSATINNGETLQLTASVSPSNVNNSAVTWSSSDTNIATVNNSGLVTAKSRGTVTITATTTDGSNLSANCNITVNQLATGITLNKTSATINNGETLQLTATVLPSNVTNANVTWSSSNTSVATVSSDGLVTAKSCGNATITATTTDGTNLSASCSVTVNQLATGITLNKTQATINNGETLQLTATVSPGNASNSAVAWSSSNTNVATVSSNGLVTAKSSGNATITATTTDGSNLSANCNITVNQLATGITLNKTSATINNGETLQLTATVLPSNVTNANVTWSSSNTNVATVSSSGLVTAKSRGNATITATTTDGTNLSASCSVTVNQLATGITLNKTQATINNGETLQLTASVSPSNTNNSTVIWSSSDTSVATVSSSGLVTAKSRGSATITATTTDGSDLSASCSVTVNQLAIGISLNKTQATLVDGTTLQLTATVSPSNANNKTVTWSTSNSNVATVSSSGLVTAQNPGTTTITVTTTDGSNLSATCQVTVTAQVATGISLNKTSASIVVDKTLQLTAAVTPSNTTNKNVTWTSSNTNIATVNSNGLVTAKAVGTASITATTADGSNLSATCQVTVTPQLATGISLNKTSATIYDGTTLQLVASISPSNTTNKTIAWTSSNTSVATVSSGGLVTALKPGTATITVTTQDGSNLSATCQLTVQKQLATSITLSQNSLEIGNGATATLVATVLPENTTDKRVMWTSSNTAIASVAAGMVQGNSMGECIITATTLDGSNLSATCHVVVTNGGGTQQGDNYLAADDIDDVVAGQAFVIPVALVNEAPITALMFDLQLPNGIILPNYNEDDVFVTLDADRQGRGHSVSTTETALAVRVVASSSRNAAFKGNSGNVLYIALRMADNVPSGTYGIDLRNVFMTTTDEQEIEAPNVKINIGAVDYHSGDANGDGYVDDVDYAITVRYILAQNPTNFVFNAADMSGDGRINITDLPMIVNAAMAYDFGTYNAPLRAPAQASANNKMYVNDFDLGGNATKTLNIVLDNATAFNAVQCDIEVPDGLTIVEQTDEWGDLAYALPVSSRMNNHDTWTDLTGSGNVRLIIASSSNKSLRSTSGAVATFKVRSAAGFSGEHELVLKNIVCADANAVRYALPDAVCLINHSANLPGDIDGNGAVNGTDLNILINIILGKDNADNYGGRANVNGEGGVDGNDLNKLINIILGKN